MVCYAVLVQQLTNTHHYSPFATWQPKWLSFNTNHIMTGPCLRASLHWSPMTLRIKSTFLIMPPRPRTIVFLYLLAYFSTFIWYHSLCLAYHTKAILAFWLFLAQATFIPISGSLHSLLSLTGMLLSLIFIWLAPSHYSRSPFKCHPSERLTTLSAPTITFRLIILLMTFIAFR